MSQFGNSTMHYRIRFCIHPTLLVTSQQYSIHSTPIPYPYHTPIKAHLTACFFQLARWLSLPQRGSGLVEKLHPQGYIAL